MDVNAGTHASPNWLPLEAIVDFKWTETKTFQDDSNFDSGGAKSQIATAYEWGIEAKIARMMQITDPTAYGVGQEALRAKCKRTTGLANVTEVRWYEMNIDDDGDVIGPTKEAYMGYVTPQWAEDGGSMDALDTVSLTMNGRGAYVDITHPEASAAVPTVTSITPATDIEAGGALAIISGHDFFVDGEDDVVSIAFGATDCPDFITHSDSLIAVTVPAGTGAKNVTVTNATGVSTDVVSFLYTVA